MPTRAPHPRASRTPWKPLAYTLACAAALTLAPSAPAQALTSPPTVKAAPVTANDGAVEIPLNPRAQEQTNWCWAATGSTIADYKGKNVTQNTFCDLAFGRPTNTSCPNSQATLANDQQAFKALGIKPGRYISDYLDYDVIESEINADRPILTRIQWSSGGGHMMVINGYDPSSGSVEWYNPWPDDQRLNVGSYDYYVNGSDFSWTHTLYGIGAV